MASSPTDGTDGPPQAAICPLVTDRGNRQVLTDWLARHERYDRSDEPLDSAVFDLCILDVDSLSREEETVQRRKRTADCLLPVLLLVPTDSADAIQHELRANRPALWQLVDGVVRFPLSEAALASQVDTLLRLREQSGQLARQEQQFKVLNRVLRHDIRNDMNVVLGWLEVLADHVDPAHRPKLERIESASTHVVELTSVARDLAESMADNDGAGPGLEPTSLTRVLLAEGEKCREAFDDATIDLPTSPPQLTVEANELLSSVFHNLLNNAVQHNDGDPVITVTVDETDGRAVVRIADNGPGVPENLKREIFDDEVKGLDSLGSGMGLYLVSTLVDIYGGEVWVEDNTPTGSVFCVVLDTVSPPATDTVSPPATDAAGVSGADRLGEQSD